MRARRSPTRASGCPRRSELRDTEPLIVCVGRLDPAKGFYDLIRATKILRERGVDARIRVAGPVDRIYPEHAGELEQLVVDLDLQEYAKVGWVDDLTALYRRCRVVAMASRPQVPGKPSEGAPTVLMEAMAQSRPVVAPREPGMTEVMGDVGTLVDQVDPEGLADALEPYLRDEVLARRGRGSRAANAPSSCSRWSTPSRRSRGSTGALPG